MARAIAKGDHVTYQSYETASLAQPTITCNYCKTQLDPATYPQHFPQHNISEEAARQDGAKTFDKFYDAKRESGGHWVTIRGRRVYMAD